LRCPVMVMTTISNSAGVFHDGWCDDATTWVSWWRL
jgi:hypothetical protein